MTVSPVSLKSQTKFVKVQNLRIINLARKALTHVKEFDFCNNCTVYITEKSCFE